MVEGVLSRTTNKSVVSSLKFCVFLDSSDEFHHSNRRAPSNIEYLKRSL